MGADSWDQWVPWIKDVKTSLSLAQAKELSDRDVSSLDELYEAAADAGEEPGETACVLDIFALSKRKTAGKCLELNAAASEKYFGAAKPTKAQIKRGQKKLFEVLERGEQVCVVAYEKGKPSEVYFAGYTVD